MATLHIHRMYVDYMGWSMDSTASQMILLIKLTSFAYNYYDGVVGNSEPISNRTQETRRRLAITKLPSLLEYFGYVYNFTTFIAGPAFEFREYMNAIEGAQFVFKGQRRTASPLGAAAMKLALSLIFMVMLVAFGPYTDLMGVLRMQESIAVKWGHILVALFLTRVKYYVAWKLAEGATILSGAGFEGFDEQGNVKGWNGVSNVDILGFEFGESIRDLSRSWNKGTQQWLERYVYSRTGNSLVATYMCSAIWHGFYPGYYLFFLTGKRRVHDQSVSASMSTYVSVTDATQYLSLRPSTVSLVATCGCILCLRMAQLCHPSASTISLVCSARR